MRQHLKKLDAIHWIVFSIFAVAALSTLFIVGYAGNRLWTAWSQEESDRSKQRWRVFQNAVKRKEEQIESGLQSLRSSAAYSSASGLRQDALRFKYPDSEEIKQLVVRKELDARFLDDKSTRSKSFIQLLHGLPLRNRLNQFQASDRRLAAQAIARSIEGALVAEIDENGSFVFASPYEAQLKLKASTLLELNNGDRLLRGTSMARTSILDSLVAGSNFRYWLAVATPSRASSKRIILIAVPVTILLEGADVISQQVNDEDVRITYSSDARNSKVPVVRIENKYQNSELDSYKYMGKLISIEIAVRQPNKPIRRVIVETSILVAFGMLSLMSVSILLSNHLISAYLQAYQLPLAIRNALDKQVESVVHDLKNKIRSITLSASQDNKMSNTSRGIIRTSAIELLEVLQRLKHDLFNHCFGHELLIELNSKIRINVAQVVGEILSTYLPVTHGVDRKIYLRINASDDETFCNISFADLSRILANVLVNSIEASSSNSEGIEVSISKSDELGNTASHVVISIKDHGCGIPEKHLPKVFDAGFTTKQKEGQATRGTGLKNVQDLVKKWDGQIIINSEPYVGTTVTISLPQKPCPDWFVKSISLKERATLVFVDDEDEIHNWWSSVMDRSFKGRVDALKMIDFKVENLKTPDECLEFISRAKVDGTIDHCSFFIDYHFKGSDLNGMDVILRGGISSRAILVTSFTESEQVITSAERFSVRMLPKYMMHNLEFPIQIGVAD